MTLKIGLYRYILVLSALLMMSLNANAQACQSLNQVKWLIGDWQSFASSTEVITESWRSISANTFEGQGATYSNGELKAEESMRIVEMSAQIFFIAKVKHNKLPVPFLLTQCHENTAKFENKNHDFPKFIEYKLANSQKLIVNVGNDVTNEFTLVFKRTKSN